MGTALLVIAHMRFSMEEQKPQDNYPNPLVFAIEQKKLFMQDYYPNPISSSLGQKPLCIAEAEDLFNMAALAYDQKKISYQNYKIDMMKAISFIKEPFSKQNYYHNPLINAVCNGDYVFTQFLLENGLSPFFKAPSSKNAFDVLNMTTEESFDSKDLKEKFASLLKNYTQNTEVSILSPGNAKDLFDIAGLAYLGKKISYERYKADMMGAIAVIQEPLSKQNYYHNPLVYAVFNGDYEFTKFLLENGLNPFFKGLGSINAFDMLNRRPGKSMMDLELKERLTHLLNDYLYMIEVIDF